MFFLRNDISTVSRIMVVQMKLLTTCRDLIQFSSATGYEKGKISENEMEKRRSVESRERGPFKSLLGWLESCAGDGFMAHLRPLK